MKERNRALDIAKGLCMICIVLGHLKQREINHVVFTFHIPVFYLITGYYLYGAEKKPFKQFIGRKARTLLVPYYVSCLFIIGLSVPINKYLGRGYKDDLWYWIRAALYGAGDRYSKPFEICSIGAIWFLWATFWGSLFMYFLIKRKGPTRVISILVLFTLAYWSRRFCWFPLSIQAGGCATLFMYIGWLYHKEEDNIKAAITPESFILITAFAFTIWWWFMHNFKTFWLVHCDIGRGAIDIFASLCGCYCVFLIAKCVDKIPLLGYSFAHLGKYSLIMLCLHIIELDLFPYWKLMEVLAAHGMVLTDMKILYIKIAFKLVYIILGTIILSNIKPIRKWIFGYRE